MHHESDENDYCRLFNGYKSNRSMKREKENERIDEEMLDELSLGDHSNESK